MVGRVSLGKQRSEGGEGGGRQPREAGVDWYAQAAFPRGRFVSYAGMSSKGTPGCRGRCAPGMNCHPGNLSGEADAYGSHFPGDGSSLLLIFLTKRSGVGFSKSCAA